MTPSTDLRRAAQVADEAFAEVEAFERQHARHEYKPGGPLRAAYLQLSRRAEAAFASYAELRYRTA